MGIQPVLIYVIRDLEPKFHWDGMKNESSTYVYLNMGQFQIRAFFGNADKSRFGRCEAVTKPFLNRGSNLSPLDSHHSTVNH